MLLHLHALISPICSNL